MTHFASKALRMPGGHHCLNNAADDEFACNQMHQCFVTCNERKIDIICEWWILTINNLQFTAFSAAWCKQYVEIMFAILSSFKFVKNAIRKWSEALSTPAKKMLVKNIFIFAQILIIKVSHINR